jgi:hypothetical protein
LDGQSSIPGRGRTVLFSTASKPALGPTSGVKRPGRKADHSSPCSAEVKNDGAIRPLPHMSSWHNA